ncbi:YPDG domain-containing protein [Corynebacterium urealyticum]|uniref:YPDG domain-containing protein n=1 Tax=Corynebacterium urealyticum TaxID=43771 RepID=UPI00293E211F|nr:YPDG domain-containing protein [Corynebacterium urealyticum]WOH94415.1 YPDG domain-containing protein [Corynebacterium urealyticum]
MANLRGLIARGGKSGAFALGFSDKMKSVAGAMAVLALATTGTVVVQSQVAPAAQAAQDPVESPGKWRAQKTVNGNVFLNREGTRSRYTPGDGDEPLAGVKVYAQWIDYNNKKQRGAVSPIYTAQSKADGTYSISLPDWTDALGTVHKWEATAGQKLRIWADNPDPENLQLAFVEGDSVFGGQGDRYFGTWNGTVGIQRVVDFNISYHEREQDWLFLPEDQQTKDQPLTSTGTTTPPGQLLGFVWYEQRGTFGDLQATPRLEGRYGDVAIPGVKVRASYVQDEVARRFDQWAADNKGYTHEKFREAQKQIMADYEAETGKSAIAETAVGETGNDGMYRIQFKGLYGSSYKTKGLLVPGDKWGELAGSSTEGTFLNGQSGSKHVNYEYMYVSPVLPDGVDAQMDVTQTAMFQDTGRFPAYTSIERTADSQINLDFTLRQTSRGFDVLEYNTTDNPAAPGDKVETETFGLIPNTAHVIVWTDSEGKEVHRCEANSDNLGVIPSCDFTVPEDLAKDTVYTATVYNASDESTALMADSFLAYVAPEYKETEVKVGEEATAERPVNKNGTAVPDSAKFAAATAEDVKNAPEFQKAGLPEDVAPQDWVTVNADGTLTIKPGADVKPGTYNVPVKVTYEDGSTKIINAPIKVIDSDANAFEPAYEDKLVVPGKETKSSPTFTDKDGKDVEVPADSKFTIPEDFTAPEGYEVSIDENTGEITVTFPDKSKLNKDTDEEFDVPVTVTYPDGSTDKTDANFKLDTDGDGEPDVTDPDDDGDGIPDEDDSNPKVPNVNDHYDPEYKDGSGKPGEDVKVEKPEFKDKDGEPTEAPEGTKFTPGENAPDGVTIDENTGEITVTIPEGANPGDEIKVPVVVTYPDGTKDNVEVTVTVTEKDNGVYEPKYKSELVVPGKETKSSPTFTDKDGKDVEVPADSKFTIPEDFTAPEGYEVSIDENTGEITVTFPDKSKLNKDTDEEFDVPVTVTYPDGSTDKTDANFKLDTDGDGEPDVTDPDDDGDGIPDEDDSNPKVPNVNDHYDPEYKDGSGKPGEDVKVEKPEFKDKDGEPTEAPEGTKFTPGENAPDGVTIDENTGEITVTIPEGANPGDEIKVPVVVTYPDGTKDNVEVTVTVTEKDNGVYEPGYEDGSGQPGDDVKIDKPVFKDNNDEETTPPEGTKFEKGEGAPGGVTVNEDGSVKVTIPEDAEPGTKIEVPVVVTYPDGSTDEVTVTVTVDEPEAPVVKDNEKYEPGYEDGSGKPGEDVTVPAPEFKDKDGQPTEAPDGTTFGPGENTPGGVTVNEDGSVKVTIPEDAEPGTKIEVPVVVTYPDGSTDEVTVTVTVDEPEAPVVKDNEKYEPGYEDGSGKPGEDVTVPAPEFKDKDGQPTEAPDGTTFGPGETPRVV